VWEIIGPGILMLRARTGVGRICNSYLVDGILIEPCSYGYGEGPSWVEWIESKNRPPVTAVFLSHPHGDHVRSLRHIAERLKLPVRGPACKYVDAPIQAGEILNGWKVLHAPGHHPQMLCLLKDNVLIAGDAAGGDGWPVLIKPSAGGDIDDHRNSCSRFASMPLDLVLPAHGDLFTNARDYFQKESLRVS